MNHLVSGLGSVAIFGSSFLLTAGLLQLGRNLLIGGDSVVVRWSLCLAWAAALLLAGLALAELVKRWAPRAAQLALAAVALTAGIVWSWNGDRMSLLGLAGAADHDIWILAQGLAAGPTPAMLAISFVLWLLLAWMEPACSATMRRALALGSFSLGTTAGVLVVLLLFEPQRMFAVDSPRPWALWSYGFLATSVATALAGCCGLTTHGAVPAAAASPSRPRRFAWFVCGLAPAWLFVAVTTHLTELVAPAPVLWGMPWGAFALGIGCGWGLRWVRLFRLLRWMLIVVGALTCTYWLIGLPALSLQMEIAASLGVLFVVSWCFHDMLRWACFAMDRRAGALMWYLGGALAGLVAFTAWARVSDATAAGLPLGVLAACLLAGALGWKMLSPIELDKLSAHCQELRSAAARITAAATADIQPLEQSAFRHEAAGRYQRASQDRAEIRRIRAEAVARAEPLLKEVGRFAPLLAFHEMHEDTAEPWWLVLLRAFRSEPVVQNWRALWRPRSSVPQRVAHVEPTMRWTLLSWLRFVLVGGSVAGLMFVYWWYASPGAGEHHWGWPHETVHRPPFERTVFGKLQVRTETIVLPREGKFPETHITYRKLYRGNVLLGTTCVAVKDLQPEPQAPAKAVVPAAWDPGVAEGFNQARDPPAQVAPPLNEKNKKPVVWRPVDNPALMKRIQDELPGYYSLDGPLPSLFTALRTQSPQLKVAVLGLGAGTLAAYAGAADQFDFYESNGRLKPLVWDTARHFDFVKQSPCPQLKLIIGSPRAELQKTDQTYDLIVVDFTCMEGLPAELATKEAISLFKSKITPAGAFAFHCTRFPDLVNIMNQVAEMKLMTRHTRSTRHAPAAGRLPSEWLLMAPVRSGWVAGLDASVWSRRNSDFNELLWNDAALRRSSFFLKIAGWQLNH